jgi:4'-phosphopantetheinyl transferase EntD
MNTTALLEAWKELLPEHICVRGGTYLELSSHPLTLQEKQSAGLVEAARMRELETGRFYAKQALLMVGVSAADLPIAANRTPLWPEGTIGSITHAAKCGEGYCAAAVGHARDIRAIGIDVEFEAGFNPRLWPTVLTARELKQLRDLPVEAREVEALKRWCIKEAVTKADQRITEPIAIDTEPGYKEGWYEATISHMQGPVRTWSGRTMRLNGLILASVVVPR